MALKDSSLIFTCDVCGKEEKGRVINGKTSSPLIAVTFSIGSWKTSGIEICKTCMPPERFNYETNQWWSPASIAKLFKKLFLKDA